MVFVTGVTNSRGGSIARLVYDDITGTTIATLTNSAIFPDGPTFREQLDDFTAAPNGALIKGLQSKDNSGNNFGAYIRGYLEAPSTGEYQFFIASDDASELWLSTNHTDAARKRIAFESTGGTPLFSGARLNESQSAKIQLTKGQKYYIEILHKQSTGTSYVQAGWQRPDGIQEIIPARHLAQHPLDPFLGRNDPNVAPTFNSSGLNGGDLPTEVIANEGDDVVLEVDVIGAQPTTIEWRRNGTVIPDENLSFLKLSRVSAVRNGENITATISNAYGQLTTATTRLSISPDTASPTVLAVEHNGNPNQLRVRFSEPVSAQTATNLSHFVLKSAGGTVIPISSAALSSDEKTVQLDGNFSFGINQSFSLAVSDVEDQAATANGLSPNPIVTPFTFSGDFLGPIGFSPTGGLRDLSVVENQIARFEVGLTGAKPWFYQWARNGATIIGATNSFIEVAAKSTNAGATFSVSVSNEFSSVVSSSAKLAIVADTNAPRLVKLRGLAGANQVEVAFDEALDLRSATNLNNYKVGNLNVIGAKLSADGKTVTLQTSTLKKGESYFASVVGISDQATVPNLVNASGSFIGEVDYSGEILADGPVRYWRLDESSGTSIASVATGIDALSSTAGTAESSPTLLAASLVPSAPGNAAIQFSADKNQRILVPNGSDLNATAGPWAKKTVEFWFKANSAPPLDATGLAATAGIWEQGAATRSIAVYLWRDPASSNPNEAELVFHAFNSGNDGPGAPFGLTTLPAVLVQHTVSVGRAYHVVAVFDGDATGTNGSLILYVDGVEAGRAGGVGQIYNHTGDVQIGRGNGVIHTRENGDFGFFDGVLDEVTTYNKALTGERVVAHYQAGIGASGGPGGAPRIISAVDRGNPNEVLVTFSKPVEVGSAGRLENFTVTTSSGAALAIQSATVLPGTLTVRLDGQFNLQPGSQYTVSGRDIADESGAKLDPNPSSVTFAFSGSGVVSIGAGSELSSRTAPENSSVRFVVVPTGTAPFGFQWLRNGVAIAGANNSELVLNASAATAGDYTVRVWNEFSEVQSSPAKVTVEADHEPARIVAIRAAAGSVNEIHLTFDEPVETSSATNLNTYSIPDLQVLSATLAPNGKELTLKTSSEQAGQTYQLSISGLKDKAAVPNLLNTATDIVPVISYVDEVLVDRPVRYWRFEETSGSTVATLTVGLDVPGSSAGTLVNAPKLGVASLVPNLGGSYAVQLDAAKSNRVTVPNGKDLNATSGPWAKKSFQFWFRAASVPAPGTTGLTATAGLWEQGAASRNIAIYLWRDPANANPDEAELVFNAVNNVATDGAGSPFGPPGGSAAFVHAPVRVGETYHVFAVFDGDSTGVGGKLILYVNGAEVGRIDGVGQIYNHTGDVQIGRGNGLVHTGENGDFGFFTGVIDEVALYNKVLSPERVAALYQAGLTSAGNAEGRITNVAVQGGKVTVTWEGSGHLYSAPSVSGPYQSISNAASPYSETLTGDSQRFFLLVP